jgi:hypothetical protein
LKCTTCTRRIMLSRLETERRFRAFVERGDPATAITVLRPEMAELGDES